MLMMSIDFVLAIMQVLIIAALFPCENSALPGFQTCCFYCTALSSLAVADSKETGNRPSWSLTALCHNSEKRMNVAWRSSGLFRKCCSVLEGDENWKLLVSIIVWQVQCKMTQDCLGEYKEVWSGRRRGGRVVWENGRNKDVVCFYILL